MVDAQGKRGASPKDAFLWLGAMIALYWSATALVLLLHAHIDVLFPNVATTYGYDPYSGAIRFAIASLIVVFPLYVWLTRILHEDLRQDPAKKELRVRRWLVYFTLFVAGVTIAIDLVTVIYTFLEGDLTTRFALKALTILVVLGGVFLYYLHELRGTWEAREGASKMIAAGVALAVLASVGAGFLVVGSPKSERRFKIDERKVADLGNIHYQISNYWQLRRNLPSSLADLADPLSGFVVPVDPETGAEYSYEKTGELSFELCATFNAPTRELPGASATYQTPRDALNENWKHGVGETCFERTIDPERYPE